jgi:hypothetical protein
LSQKEEREEDEMLELNCELGVKEEVINNSVYFSIFTDKKQQKKKKKKLKIIILYVSSFIFLFVSVVTPAKLKKHFFFVMVYVLICNDIACNMHLFTKLL